MKSRKRIKMSIDTTSNYSQLTRKSILKQEKTAMTSWAWAVCTQSWYAIHGSNKPNDADVNRCLKKAEELANDVLDLVFTAGIAGISNRLAAISIMKKAVLWSKSSSDWRLCAIAYIGLKRKAEAKKCLKKSDELAKNSADRAACANVRRQVEEIGSPENIVGIVETAENNINLIPEEYSAYSDKSLKWLERSYKYKERKDEKGMERCIQTAEKFCQTATDWYWCAIARSNQLQPPNPDSKRCISKAEKLSKTAGDWCRCAEAWSVFLQPLSDDSTRCMHEAEKLCNTTNDWYLCVNEWISLRINQTGKFKEKLPPSSSADAKRCMHNAEKLCRTIDDWYNCAEHWSEHELSPNADAKKCMRNMEKLCKTVDDWCRCARKWDFLRDEYRPGAKTSKLPLRADAKRCLHKAGKLCRTIDDWFECALGAWNDRKEHRKYMEQAMKLAKTVKDWNDCANSWYQHDMKEAGHCFKKQEALIRSGDCTFSELLNYY